MAYQAIADHAVIGDMRTAALVAADGTIDWLCLPNFDSPSVFAAILDDQKGGHFSITAACPEVACKQFYWPQTNVLVTRFLASEGAAELSDFMPMGVSRHRETTGGQLIRRLTVTRGSVPFHVECRPAFNYALADHEVRLDACGAVFTSADLSVELAGDKPMEIRGPGIVSDFTLNEGQTATFVLRQVESQTGCGPDLSPEEAEDEFRRTVDYWRRWISKSQYNGRWREIVERSALVLKLLTYEPTGAIVAAPTCSLPERIGGNLNWDYRFTWIRDSAFTVYAFLRLGFTEEAERFMGFLSGLLSAGSHDGPLQVMYGIDGRTDLRERNLDHLDGYMGSRPVRVGNGAYDQLQLDIYGALMDATYLYNKHGAPISSDLWFSLSGLLDWVCANWHREDYSIWEVRGGPQQFVYSKLMCWVALDRGIRLAEKRSFPADIPHWRRIRDTIFRSIMDRGWSDQRQSFVQRYDSDVLDAANLMMPLTFFLSPTDPRMLKTLQAVLLPPEQGGLVSNNLVYRYKGTHSEDDPSGEEGTFNICTFWLVEALTRAGRFRPDLLEEARLMFERMLGFANHVGLYAEETGPRGEALGNFPQAFTHLALVSAAFNLDRALGVDR